MGRPRSRRFRRRREGAEPFAGEGSVAAAEEVTVAGEGSVAAAEEVAVAGEGSVAEGRARAGTGTVEVEVEVEVAIPRGESAARAVAAKDAVAAPSQRTRWEVRWRRDRVRGRVSYA